MVSDVDRHVIVLAVILLALTLKTLYLLDFQVKKILQDWTPRTTNTAGDLRIGSGTAIVQAVETRQEILVFTDQALHSMAYWPTLYFWY